MSFTTLATEQFLSRKESLETAAIIQPVYVEDYLALVSKVYISSFLLIFLYKSWSIIPRPDSGNSMLFFCTMDFLNVLQEEMSQF